MSHGADSHTSDGPPMAHGTVLNTGITNGKIAIWLFLASEVMFFTGLIGAYIVLRSAQPVWADPRAKDYPLAIGLTAFNTFVLICSSVTLVFGLQHIQKGNRAKGNMGLLATTLLGAFFVGVQAYEYHHLMHGDLPEVGMSAIVATAGGDTAEKITASSKEAPRADAPAPGKKIVEGVITEAPEDHAHITLKTAKGNVTFAMVRETDLEINGEPGKFPMYPSGDLFSSCFYTMTGFHGFHVFVGVVILAILTIMGFAGKFGPKHYAPVEMAGLYWHFVDLVWIILFAIVYLI